MEAVMKSKKVRELVAEVAKNVKSEADLSQLSSELVKMTVEAALGAEMEHHLGYEKHAAEGRNSGNSRNGRSSKTLKGTHGEARIEVPRDRSGTFEPQLLGKYQTRLTDFDDQILCLYAKGLTTRQIVETFDEMYGAQVSPALISKVTDAVHDQVQEWQNRNLDPLYPIVYLDCIVVKVRQNKQVINKAIYRAPNKAEAQRQLEAFGDRWDEKYCQIAKMWERHWHNLITLFDYPPEIRKTIYTTNAIESLNSVIRKSTRQRKIFPTDESALKVVYLAIRAASRKWSMPIREWKAALNQFIIQFDDRITGHL